jgi:hypothetical protein
LDVYFRIAIKKALAIISFSLITILSNAQLVEVSDKWQAGFMGGVTFNNLTGSSLTAAFGGKEGFMAGAFVEYQVNEVMQLRLEFNLEQRNVSYGAFSSGLREYDTSSYVCRNCYYAFDINYTNSYLTLPVYVQYMRKQDRLHVGARLGLYYSILLQSWNEGYEELYIDPVGSIPFQLPNIRPGFYRLHISGEAVDVVNTYDAGLILGIFARYDLNHRISLQVDGSLWLGFAGLFENPGMVVVNNRTYMLRTGLGYKLFQK